MAEVSRYLADGEPFRYPLAGDALPPRGTKLLLLTVGHTCVVGTWADEGYLGWLPLPTRDKLKEELILHNVGKAVQRST